MDRSTTSTEHRAAMPVGGIFPARVVLPARWRDDRESRLDAVTRRAIHANAILWRLEDDRLAGQTRTCGQLETRAAVDAP